MTSMPSSMSRRSFLAAGLAVPSLTGAAEIASADRLDLRGDVDLLARAYGALHPGLYRYQTPAQAAARFAALRAGFTQPRTRAEAYVAFARATASVRCGHSYPNFYNQSAAVRTALFGGRDRLPLHFRWIDGRMIVTRDLSASARVTPGTQVLAIDGLAAPALLQALLPLARADGSNDGKRRRQMDVTGADRWEAFDVYLPMLFPRTVARGDVALDLRAPDGSRRRVDVPLMTATERAAAAPSPSSRPRDAVLWTLERQPDGIAVLRMPTWTLYNATWDWRAWLNATLDEIAGDGTRAVIVDLRGNEGGLDCGQAILSRLVARDLVVATASRRVRYRQVPDDLAAHVDTWDDSFRDWGEQAVGPRADGFYDLVRGRDNAKGDIVIQPEGRHLAASLVVLVDSSNSSATFQFAQTVKDARLGRLVGETTGGNRRGINGGAFLFLRLPASGLEIDIPLIGYFPATTQPDAGIEPDVTVVDGIGDILSGTDRGMATALRLLR